MNALCSNVHLQHFLVVHVFPCTKGDNPYLVTFLMRTSIFEWYVVWCDSKNRYQKDRCLKEIGLHAQIFHTQYSTKLGGPI